MKRATAKKQSEDITDFMLAEYSLLKDFRGAILSQVENRVSLLFASISGIAGVLALVFQSIGANISFFVVASILTALVFVLGLLTFLRVLEGHISFTNYTRGINRIRRYFAEKDSSIGDYLILPITDDSPKFGVMGFSAVRLSKSGLTGMTILMNSITFSAFAALSLNLLFRNSIIPILVIAALAGALVWFIQLGVYRSRTRQAENNTLKKFPSENGG
jgi:hypothetical protein